MQQKQDSGRLPFSQRYKYEKIPQRLKLEELDENARVQLQNILDLYIGIEYPGPKTIHEIFIKEPWVEIMRDFFAKDTRRWSSDPILYEPGVMFIECERCLEQDEFYEIFDFLEHIMQHPLCPQGFIDDLKEQFKRCCLAYVIDTQDRPIIYPAATEEEGASLLQALEEIHEAGLDAAAEHLQQASDCIHQNDWNGSVRESIHAVEAVARKIVPGESKNIMKDALSSLNKQKKIHPAFQEAIHKLYGYASDEPGTRHSSDGQTEGAGEDEALCMLGVCASLASYLWRRHNSK